MIREAFKRTPRTAALSTALVLIYVGIVIWAIWTEGWAAIGVLVAVVAINYAVMWLLRWAAKRDERRVRLRDRLRKPEDWDDDE